MNEQELEEHLQRLERLKDEQRIATELAEIQARAAQRQAQERAAVLALRAKEAAEQEEWRRLQKENAEQIRRWQLNPFDSPWGQE